MEFIIIANAWGAGKDNPTSKHRIAVELVRRGHRVLWIEGAGMRVPSVGSSHDRLRIVRKVFTVFRGARQQESVQCEMSGVRREGGGKGHRSFRIQHLPPDPQPPPSPALWVLSPLFIPLPQYETIRQFNGFICRLTMRFWTWRLGFGDVVLINYVPILAEAMRVCKVGESRAARVIYHCVDRWEAFPNYDASVMIEMDRRCCVYADLVIASAAELYERCKQYNPRTVLISHGVDWEHFHGAVMEVPTADERQVAVDTGNGQSGEVEASNSLPTVCNLEFCAGSFVPTIGYFGFLSEWLDQDLILKLAQEIPKARIILIGKADVPMTRLQGLPNIHVVGPKPFADLPAYIAQFTVGIIPFIVNDLTRAVNPIKLREMLAAGCPVVSTALPEVERCAREIGVERYVSIAPDHEAFVKAVASVLVSPLSVDERRKISDRARVESWSGKVDKILEIISHQSC